MSKKQGFTLVELIIVIVTVGILTTLVAYSYSLVRAKERDTNRQTAINAIWTQLENCYNDKCQGTYPASADLLNDSWLKTNLPELNKNYLVDTGSNKIQIDNVSLTSQYQYAPTGKTAGRCTGTKGDNPCTKYVLRAYQEQNPNNPYQKKSVN